MCDTTMKMTTLSLTMLFVMKRYFRSLQNVICQLPLLALSVSCNAIRLRMVHRHMQYLRRDLLLPLLLIQVLLLVMLHEKLAEKVTTVSFWFCRHLEQTAQLHIRPSASAVQYLANAHLGFLLGLYYVSSL